MLSIIKNFLHSIALVPSLLALCFMLLALFMISVPIDYEQFNVFDFLIIENPKDIQFILAYVIGGIFTLTIFSYTMVMNVLNRNINNYSPRLIPLLLSEKHHQIILGFTSGTIIFAIILSIAITNSSGNYFPSIGAGMAGIFSIICIFLFIYFIHSVSKSIHINYILDSLYQNTVKQMNKRLATYESYEQQNSANLFEHIGKTDRIGDLRLYKIESLKKLCKSYDCKIQVLKLCGETVLNDDILFRTDRKMDEEQIASIRKVFAIDHEVAIDVHEVGFKHFVEVAVKASSPAINDPGTSNSCINYLTQLFILRLNHPLNKKYVSLDSGNLLIRQEKSITLLKKCFIEMYRFMKDDPLLKISLKEALFLIQSRSAVNLNFKWNQLIAYDTRL